MAGSLATIKYTAFCLLLGWVALPVGASATFPNPLLNGFESGTLAGWDLHRLARLGSVSIVRGGARAGEFAARIELRPGDHYKDSWKSELSDPHRAAIGEEVWYRTSHWLPKAQAPDPDNACIIAQWHNSASPGEPDASPPVALRLVGDTLQIEVRHFEGPRATEDDGERRIVGILRSPARARWHDFVFRVRWFADERGRVDVWHDGKRIVRYRGPVGYRTDRTGPYFKAGLYCRRSPARPYVVFFDEYRRGSRREDVLLPGDRDP